MKFLITIILFLSIASSKAQVGVNTTDPKAILDIKASNQATPTNTDGILIPRIDTFPIIDPTANQQGMMVYLTTTSGGKPPGFYYWNNTSSLWETMMGTDNQTLSVNDNKISISNANTIAIKEISDTDENTKIEVEESVDNNEIRFYMEGLQVNRALTLKKNNYNLLMINVENFSRNTFMGNSSGLNTNAGTYPSGNDNTFYGSGAGEDNNTGWGNSYFGTVAGQHPTGSLNTYIGLFSGSHTSNTGTKNVLLGDHTGMFLTAGSYNVFLGSQSGYKSVIGSSNVFLGYKSGYNELGNNKLYIDNSDSSSPLIYGDFNTNRLRINGVFQINDPSNTGFEFPNIDGLIGQVLQTDGDGQLAFVNSSILGTDNQDIIGSVLSGTDLTIGIENGSSQIVDLSSLQDGIGTDNQTIDSFSLIGTDLSISLENDGIAPATVDLSPLKDADWYESGNTAPDNITDDIFTSGKVGINEPSPATSLELNGGLSLSPGSSINLTSDTTLTIGDTSLVVVNNVSGSLWSLSFTDGLAIGQLLYVVGHQNNTSGANISDFTSNIDISTNSVTIYANDTLSFIWNGTHWLQISYSDN